MKGAGRMQEIVIREIGESRASDINIKNERLRLFGRMIPAYQNGKWSYSIARNEEESWERFPDENYDYGQMAKDHIFLGAYDGSVCVALAILRQQCYKYLYLYDLKVNGAYRGRHIATRLLNEAVKCASAHGYRSIWTIGQDNNLAARCVLYKNDRVQVKFCHLARRRLRTLKNECILQKGTFNAAGGMKRCQRPIRITALATGVQRRCRRRAGRR